MKLTNLIFVIFILLSLDSFCQITCISKENGTKSWNLETKSSVYQVIVNEEGEVIPGYYGPKAHAEQFVNQGRNRGNGPFVISEVPVRGKYADKIPIVEVVFADHTRECELIFESAEILDIGNRKTLRITQKDKFYPFVVNSYIRVLPEYDILEKWIEVKNVGKKEVIKIENLMSASVTLPADRYFLTHHAGRWASEFQLQKTELTAGIKTLQSRDFYAFQNTPWFSITSQQGEDVSNGNVWFGQVHYSGNWRIDMEATFSSHLQIAGGINFWDSSWELKPGETFVTPKMSIGFTQNGTDEVARLTAAYIRHEILPAPTRDKIRPIIYNSWYATGFNVNEENQLRLAKVAKDLGVELFVIDDGWFKGRKDDRSGLGDWFVDLEKFPNGLNPMIKKINDLGLDFGIWVEPEMVNPKSELYKKHPDWALNYPNRTKTEWRNQLTLNLAREDVYKYLLESMTDLLKTHNIKFIKWDRNRGLTEPGWSSAPEAVQREVRLRYIQNLYRLIDELRTRFPDVLFESCSSGGGRPDLGMLSRMDQTWASDNTNPIDRLFIQYGYLSAYPANTMVCWTTGYDPSSINLSLDYIFDVAMTGVLGIGQNITEWDEVQKATARKKISEYKSIRHLVQQGTLYRLKSPFEGNRISLEYVAPDTSEAVLFCYNLGMAMEGATIETRSNKQLILKGLDPTAMYTFDMKSGKGLSGDYLMNIGIPWPLNRAYKSVILKLKKM